VTAPWSRIAAAAAITVLIWGTTPIATGIAVRTVDPGLVGILRTLLAALVAVPLVLLFGLPRPRGRVQWLLLLVSSLGGFVLFPVLYSWGVKLTSAAHSALLIAILPVITALIVSAMERRLPGAVWWLGAAVAAVGEWILIAARPALSSAGSGWLGDVLIFLGCVAVSAGYIAGSRLSRTMPSLATTLWGVTVGGVILLPACFLYPELLRPQYLAPEAIVAILFLAVASTIVAYILWYWALVRGGVVRVGLAQFAQPLVSVVLAMLILHEHVELLAWLAAACIAAGLVITHLARQ
jgi:drug/metabolite transporter (DMT)-like permease